jgi:peroxiredoxin family protein/TusA-related sulfurtransferase
VAYRILEQAGFENIRNLTGGYTTWKNVYDDIPEIEFDNFTESGDPVNQPEGGTMEAMNTSPGKVKISVNACGLQCPGPIMEVYKALKDLEEGACIEISASDPGFGPDVKTWCQRTGNTLLESKTENGTIKAIIRKGISVGQEPVCQRNTAVPNDKSIIIFSGDLDKAIASFIIANGSLAMGRKVTMFFTFWGLNILRKNQHVKVKKGLIEKMFGGMMPRGSKRLGLSKMNMLGMGAKMIRSVMKSKNVDSLEELIKKAMDNGVRIVACTMSMDVMGIRKEELIDGIEYAGVADYLGAAETSDTNLFI